MGQKIQRPDLGGPFPEHIAIIMDGNGRWAGERGMRRIFGHRAGIDSVREITTECATMGVKSLTLYSFSVENWKRPRSEIRYLMRLLRKFLVDERPTLRENDVRLSAIGRIADLPQDAQDELARTAEFSKHHRGMHLRLALAYGSRTELADAMQAFGRDVQAGKVRPEDVTDETLRGYLYDPGMPDPDLLIRTAGEMRLSNFLLWQISYAEFYVANECWPEFRKPQLMEALRSYASRERKYGGLITDVPPVDANARSGQTA